MTKKKGRIDILGAGIDNLNMEEVLLRIDELIRHKTPSLVCTANANHIRLVRNDDEFARIYDEAEIVTVDGMLIMWVSKILGHPLKEKVSGSDLVVEICKKSSVRGYRIYFLGAAEGVAKKAKARCEKLYPGISIVGLYSPKRKEILDDEQSKAMISRINSSGANILLVAFGPPLQEKWIKRHMSELEVPVAIGVGGAIDYLAGIIKRPPVFVRNIGMEWFARLIQNPARYAKRYLMDLVVFYYVVLEKLKKVKF